MSKGETLPWEHGRPVRHAAEVVLSVGARKEVLKSRKIRIPRSKIATPPSAARDDTKRCNAALDYAPQP